MKAMGSARESGLFLFLTADYSSCVLHLLVGRCKTLPTGVLIRNHLPSISMADVV